VTRGSHLKDLRRFLAAQTDPKAKNEGEKTEKDDEEDEKEGAAAAAKVSTMGRDDSIKAFPERRSRCLVRDCS